MRVILLISLFYSMNVYGAETNIILVDTPGIRSDGEIESDFSRFLNNTLNECTHWMTQKLVISKEDSEARSERLKIFYPQVCYFFQFKKY